MEFINESYISSLLEREDLLNEGYQKEIILKGLDAKGLSLKESAALLNINSLDLLDELFHAAKKVKEKIYGNRLVLFAPLYGLKSSIRISRHARFHGHIYRKRKYSRIKKHLFGLESVFYAFFIYFPCKTE